MVAPSTAPTDLRVVTVASQGADHPDADRIQALFADFNPQHVDFDRSRKLSSALQLYRRLRQLKPDLVALEGTGIGAAGAVMAWSTRSQRPFILSSGDAVAAYWALKRRWLWLPGFAYETVLYRRCAGFIGWTPYLVGRALTLGARRAMTAEGWAPPRTKPVVDHRAELGISEDSVVFGLVGSLRWNERVGYCYGHELVSAIRQTERPDVHVIIVGDGDGRDRLAALAGDDLGKRVHLIGAVSREDVPGWLATCDVLSLPQSVDGVGSFRYTTKLAEYLEADRVIVTTQIPAAYDLDDGRMRRIPGNAPWETQYIAELASLMQFVSTRLLSSQPTSPTPPISLAKSFTGSRVHILRARVRSLVTGSPTINPVASHQP